MAQRQNSGPIIGGVVAALLIAVLIALGIVLAVIFRRRQKRKDGVNIQISSHDNSFKDLSNPVYSGKEMYCVDFMLYVHAGGQNE